MISDRAKRQLIVEAIAAGFVVEMLPNSDIVNIRRGKTYRSVGVTIWGDGIATRSDIRHDLCLAIRTVKQVRQILGLNR